MRWNDVGGPEQLSPDQVALTVAGGLDCVAEVVDGSRVYEVDSTLLIVWTLVDLSARSIRGGPCKLAASL